MKTIPGPHSFEDFRASARQFLNDRVHPDEIAWEADDSPLHVLAPTTRIPPSASGDEHGGGTVRAETESARRTSDSVIVSASELAGFRLMSMHRDSDRWRLMYRLLWRMRVENDRLLAERSDPDVADFELRSRQVARDLQKMHAFLRFRRIHDATTENEKLIAWYEPGHRIVRAAAPLFIRRLGGTVWSILTPDESAHWDTSRLSFGPGVAENEVPLSLAPETPLRHWAAHFEPTRGSTNAAHVNRAVTARSGSRSQPRFVHRPSESRVVSTLMAGAVDRVIESRRHGGVARVPEHSGLGELKRSAKSCSACALGTSGACAVFGEGTQRAKIMIVGEQPGDEDEKAGHVFLGPAGKLLDRVLERVGLERGELYLTNAVKHFRFERRGRVRRALKPTNLEVLACRPWLEAEITAVKPEIIVCLGATAARAVLGRRVAIKDHRGKCLSGFGGVRVLVTYHPSAILHVPDDEDRKRMLAEMALTLRQASRLTNVESRPAHDFLPA